MKRYISYTAIIVGLCLPIVSIAQRGIPSNAIMVNVLGLGAIIGKSPLSSTSLSYEHAFRVKRGYGIKRFSTVLDLEYGRYSSLTSQVPNLLLDEVIYNGFGVELQGRMYAANTSEMAPMGLFGGVYGRYMSLSGQLDGDQLRVPEIYQGTLHGTSIRAGLTVGYKIGTKRFVVEPLVDYYMEFSNGFVHESVNPFNKKDGKAVLLRAGLKMGFRF